MKKLKKIVVMVALICVAILAFAGCDGNTETGIKVSFLVDGEQYSTATFSGTVVAPTDPQKEGYVFKGWFFDYGTWEKPLTYQSLLDQPIAGTDGIKVYAQFVEYSCEMDGKQHEYEKTVIEQNGCTTYGKERYQCKNCSNSYEQTTYPTGHNEKLIDSKDATCTENGYKKYKCETCQAERTQTVYSTGHNLNRATRECSNCDYAEDFVVTFNTNGGTTIEKYYVKYNQLITGEIVTTKTGYDFSGWKNGTVIFNIATDKVTKDITLTAQWTAHISHVTFNNSSETARDVTFGSKVTLPTLTKTGYAFGGWSYNGVKITSTTWNIDVANVELEPIFTPNTYTVTLEVTTGSVASKTVQATYGEKVQFPVPTGGVGTFAGWYNGSTKFTDETGLSLNKWSRISALTLHDMWIVEVATLSDFEAIKTNTGKNITWKLVSDITMPETAWEPIQNFAGVLDGNGHSIIGLKLTDDSAAKTNKIGLFGALANGATIENLTVSGVNSEISNLGKSYSFGIIAAYANDNVTIQNCVVSGTVTLAKQSAANIVYAGGICGQIGYSNVEISLCKNNAAISGGTYTAGIIGYVKYITLAGCVNNGNITNAGCGAGVVGYGIEGVIAQMCKNTGNISADNFAGGIVGGSPLIYVDQAANYGNITVADVTNMQYGAGGIVGSGYFINDDIPATIVTNSYNMGNIRGGAGGGNGTGGTAGGIIGSSYGAEVSSCYNAGSVTGYMYTGGIVGLSISPSITECLNAGSISGSLRSPMTYKIGAGTISGCYYFGSSYDQANATSASSTYSKEFYLNSLFWQEYNEAKKTGYWIFHEDAYPTLMFEDALEEMFK
ncbi:MAG: InlB B-repeat-containing protein [Eubacteriales bacterium]